MKKTKGEITKRFLVAALVVAPVVGVSALPMHTSTHNQNSVARSLKNIQTDKSTQYAFLPPTYAVRFVERVPAMTGESRALTENLKLAAATL
jgi:hypothetical protein